MGVLQARERQVLSVKNNKHIHYILKELMKERMNERTNEWIIELINESIKVGMENFRRIKPKQKVKKWLKKSLDD